MQSNAHPTMPRFGLIEIDTPARCLARSFNVPPASQPIAAAGACVGRALLGCSSARHGARADSRRRTLAGALDARIADATRSADAAKIRLAGLPAPPAPCIHAGRHPSVGTREYSIDNHPARRSAVATYEARDAQRDSVQCISHTILKPLRGSAGFVPPKSPRSLRWWQQ